MNRSRTAGEMTLLFLAFFLPGYLAQATMQASGPVSNGLLLQSILMGIPQFLLMAYVAGVTGPSTGHRWGFIRLHAGDALRIAALVAACFAVIGLFFGLVAILPEQWTRAIMKGYRWGLQGIGQLPLALLFGLTAGYREEFFFRSYLLGRMEEMGVPLSISVAGSTILFSLGHAYEGILGMLLVAALGLLLCAAYVRWRNVHVIAIAHGAYNVIVLCLSLVFPDALPAAVHIPCLPLHA
jgi:membrane protease YdiL (CAAX protease family)